MNKTVFRTLLASATALVLIGGTEGQIFSIAGSGIRSLASPSQSQLFDNNRVHKLDVTLPFSVLAAGDIASCAGRGYLSRMDRNLRYAVGLPRAKTVPNEGMIETTAILEQYPETMVLALGDLVYRRGEAVGFEDCYDPYWGAAWARTWPTPGNHEYQSPFAYAYYDYWQDRAGPDRNGYYALKAGNWLILSLNSEIDASPGSAQAEWVKEVLAAHMDSCAAAYFHKPAYSSVTRSRTDSARALFRLVADAGVRFVLHGHNHFYERTVPLNADGKPTKDGTIAFVVGAGGKSTRGNIEPAAFSERLITGTMGMLKLTFKDKAASWTYLTGSGSTETDSGTIQC
ncbi:Alkaline phosphatase (plasmid) [Sulfitobacter indolifex]|uniref:metallophosphoesterase family protein n=1 Tax=Sulfitobacter indolifex TaxID=225422 RepID=UPI001FADE430|nr:metallophosphoesterase [Sulfitobacter indolifex]UOA21363.1 Alkaline phosphatase [Sulfitobacter indolifex]